MDPTSLASSVSADDRRRAHRNVGAAAGATFLIVLLLGAFHQSAGADPVVPSAAPAVEQPSVPAQPSIPGDRDGDGPHPHDGRGFGFGGGDRGGGPPGGRSASPSPSPSPSPSTPSTDGSLT